MLTENLDNFIHKSSICIHSVSEEGIIVYANECALEVLGYTKEEYVGHHTSEFQLDKSCFDDIMQRFYRSENLHNYPVRVQGKKDIKYIIYNSSVYEENGEFIHTRCYGTEVLKPIYDAFLKHLDP